MPLSELERYIQVQLGLLEERQEAALSEFAKARNIGRMQELGNILTFARQVQQDPVPGARSSYKAANIPNSVEVLGAKLLAYFGLPVDLPLASFRDNHWRQELINHLTDKAHAIHLIHRLMENEELFENVLSLLNEGAESTAQEPSLPGITLPSSVPAPTSPSVTAPLPSPVERPAPIPVPPPSTAPPRGVTSLIDVFCQKLHLPDDVCNAARITLKSQAFDILDGWSNTEVAAASILCACNQLGVPLTFTKIRKTCGVDLKEKAVFILRKLIPGQRPSAPDQILPAPTAKTEERLVESESRVVDRRGWVRFQASRFKLGKGLAGTHVNVTRIGFVARVTDLAGVLVGEFPLSKGQTLPVEENTKAVPTSPTVRTGAIPAVTARVTRYLQGADAGLTPAQIAKALHMSRALVEKNLAEMARGKPGGGENTQAPTLTVPAKVGSPSSDERKVDNWGRLKYAGKAFRVIPLKNVTVRVEREGNSARILRKDGIRLGDIDLTTGAVTIAIPEQKDACERTSVIKHRSVSLPVIANTKGKEAPEGEANARKVDDRGRFKFKGKTFHIDRTWAHHTVLVRENRGIIVASTKQGEPVPISLLAESSSPLLRQTIPTSSQSRPDDVRRVTRGGRFRWQGRIYHVGKDWDGTDVNVIEEKGKVHVIGPTGRREQAFLKR